MRFGHWFSPDKVLKLRALSTGGANEPDDVTHFSLVANEEELVLRLQVSRMVVNDTVLSLLEERKYRKFKVNIHDTLT